MNDKITASGQTNMSSHSRLKQQIILNFKKLLG